MHDPWIVDAEFEVVEPPLRLEGPAWGRDFPKANTRNKRFPEAPAGWIPEHLREPMWKRTGRLWTWGIFYGWLAIVTVGWLLLCAGARLGLWPSP